MFVAKPRPFQPSTIFVGKARLYQPSLIFVVKARNLPLSGAHEGASPGLLNQALRV